MGSTLFSIDRTAVLLLLLISSRLDSVDSFHATLSTRKSKCPRRLGTFTWNAFSSDDDDARSAFGTRQYWDDVYTGKGDFPKDEYSWYYGWDTLKPLFTQAIPSKDARILCPGIGNDIILLDLWGAGYHQLTAFDYSEHAVERQQDLLSWEPKALEQVEILQRDARTLDPEWTGSFDCILEKGALDAIYLSGDGHVEQAVAELQRVLRPGGILVSVSGVVPEELRRELFHEWKWIRDGTNDLKAGCFILENA
jgi:SAM-dependent methyltransferase